MANMANPPLSSPIGIWVWLKMVSTPLYPMVLLIIIPIKWLFHWEYTQHFQTYPNMLGSSRPDTHLIWGPLDQFFFGDLSGDQLPGFHPPTNASRSEVPPAVTASIKFENLGGFQGWFRSLFCLVGLKDH